MVSGVEDLAVRPDESEPVSGGTLTQSTMLREVRATRQERRCRGPRSDLDWRVMVEQPRFRGLLCAFGFQPFSGGPIPRRSAPPPLDKDAYRPRNRIERFFS